MLQLCGEYPEDALAAALEMALDGRCYQLDGVRELVRRQVEGERPGPADLQGYPELAAVTVAHPDLSRFNQLLLMGGES